jgi:hypothetical protein
MACSSPRWTLCKTVWRATPRRFAASLSGRYPSGTSGTNRARASSVIRIRQGAPGVPARRRAGPCAASGRSSFAPELVSCALDGEQLAGGIWWRRVRNPGAFAHARHSRLVELQAGAGAPSLLVEDLSNLIVGMMASEAKDELDGRLGRPTGLTAAAGQRHREVRARAALPVDLDAGAPWILAHEDHHLLDQRAQQLFALA